MQAGWSEGFSQAAGRASFSEKGRGPLPKVDRVEAPRGAGRMRLTYEQQCLPWWLHHLPRG